ncbi:HEAT repeat domain-containing protein [bacterium]|nr:HEAT repeat domain-containing protein [bacterium]
MDRKIIDYMEQNEDLEGLSSVIRSKKHPEMRIEAIKALANLSQTSARSLLLELLNDEEDPQIRLLCAQILGKRKDEKAIPALHHSLKDENAAVRAYSAGALAKLKKTKSVRPLLNLLKDPQISVRKHAVIALGEIRDDQALDKLIPLLYDESDQIKIVTAKAIGRIGGEKALQALTPLLSVKNEKVLKAVLEGLGRVGGAPVENLLEDFVARTDSEPLKSLAIEILERLERKKTPMAQKKAGKSSRDLAEEYESILEQLKHAGQQ